MQKSLQKTTTSHIHFTYWPTAHHMHTMPQGKERQDLRHPGPSLLAGPPGECGVGAQRGAETVAAGGGAEMSV